VPEVYFHYDLPFSQLTAEFLGKVSLGTWRVVSLASWGYADDPRFAVIMYRYSDPELTGPKQDLEMFIPEGMLDERIAYQSARGYAPVLLTTVGDQDDVLWTIVFEKQEAPLPSPPHVYKRLSSWEAVDKIQVEAPTFQVIRSFDVYYRGTELVFTCIAWPDPATATDANGKPLSPRVARRIRKMTVKGADDINPMAFESLESNRVMRQGWVRPDLVVPAPFNDAEMPGRRLFSQWYSDTFIPWPESMLDDDFDAGVQVRGPMTYSQTGAIDQEMWDQGWVPYRIGANGHGGYVRFCMTFARVTNGRVAPLPRQFVVVDRRDPGPPPARVGFYTKLKDPQSAFGALFKNKGPGFKKPDPQGPKPQPQPSSPGQLNPGSLPKINRYAKLDEYIRDRVMMVDGPRCVQVAIFRGDRLVVNRAYTLAERGHPVAHTDHAMPVASVSKALTGLAAVATWAPNGTLEELLNTNAIQALGLGPISSPSNALKLAETNLVHFFTHSTGWPKDLDDAETALLARGAPAPAIEGDTLPAIEARLTGLYVRPPGVEGVYGGAGLRALSEGISWKRAGDRRLYQPEMRSFFFPGEAADADETILKAHFWDRRNASLGPRKHLPAHCSFPQVAWAEDVVQEPFLINKYRTPIQYSGNLRWPQGAGAWCMSARTVAKILCGLFSAAAVPKLLSPAQVQLLLTPGSGSGLFTNQAWPDANGQSYTMLHHNGAWPGAGAMAAVYFPDGSTAPHAKTTCIVMIANQDRRAGGYNEFTVGAILDIANDIEATWGWEPGDLFDE
jgi:hypothetical protein